MLMVLPEWWDKYVVYYPQEDEPDYDGVHCGGIKGIRDDAPQEVKDAFSSIMREEAEAKADGVMC